ncbi:DUF1289 domain-containing protein [Saccharospirillum salsuginis]|uniref:DUF1289 domain-containing protein n=1 Tax=Saccharospirillum salsuginis TaxID=418750 RepID=A0A918KEF2_9GAMM|nr:DUF1289 domain-containing protein [Saccharospirillum salsuginis]GGX59304.1 hypothetical protein GCM10007392_28930 [Saccharospirillum salsuginis]
MKQLEFFDIPSPCIDVCESGARGYCKGCYRSREERQHWHRLDNATKRQILDACNMRRYRHQLALRRRSESDEPSRDLPDIIPLLPDDS